MTTNPDLQAMQEQQLREIARERLQSAAYFSDVDQSIQQRDQLVQSL